MENQNPNANFQQFAQQQQPMQQPMQPVQNPSVQQQPSVTNLVAPTTTEKLFDYVSFKKFVKANGGRVVAGITPNNRKLVLSVGAIYVHIKNEIKSKSLELIKTAPERLLVGISREVDANGSRSYLLVEDDPSRRQLEVMETFDFN